MRNKFKNKQGFTLVELLVAVSLFVVVTTISIGAILSVFDANKKAQSSKTVVDNLNLAIENMARIVRFGSNYHCANLNLPLSNPRNCNTGANTDTLLAVNFNGSTIVYKWDGTINDPIERSDDGGNTYTAITAPDVKIQYLRFYVFGTDPGPNTDQPYAVVVIKGYVGDKLTNQTIFSIETLMSQRTLDI
jgi:prepilin-type N-terminal cleavage/methylation domain-containing protein